MGLFREIKRGESTIHLLEDKENLENYLDPETWISQPLAGGSRYKEIVHSKLEGGEKFPFVIKWLRPDTNSYFNFNREPATEILVARDLNRYAACETRDFLYRYEEPVGWIENIKDRKGVIYIEEKGSSLNNFAQPFNNGVTIFITRGDLASVKPPPKINTGIISDLVLGSACNPDFYIFAEKSYVHTLRKYVKHGDGLMENVGFEDTDSGHIFGSHLFSMVESQGRQKVKVVRYDLENIIRKECHTPMLKIYDPVFTLPLWEKTFKTGKEFAEFVRVLKFKLRCLKYLRMPTGSYRLKDKLSRSTAELWQEFNHRSSPN